MQAIAFLNPMLLWALPLAAVPIVIHLLNRRRFQRVPWAAMEYLLAAMKRNRKRLRMEQWLVLLLRVLAVLLLIGLVSRPQLGGGGLIGTRTHHVVLLDDSASMTQLSGSQTLFEKAQDRVRILTEDLAQRRAGDVFSIVRTSRPAQPDLWGQRVGPDLGRRIGALTKEWRVGDGSCDVGQALRTTVQRGRDVKEAGRTEYYLVGDQRAHDWATVDDRAAPGMLAALQSLRGDQDRLSVLTIGGQPHNLAVAEVRLLARLPIAGVPTVLGIDVQNHGLDPTTPTTVAVEIDGQSRVSVTVPQLAPGERATLPFGHTFHQAGFHHVEARLEATERFPLDDRRSLALDVRAKSRVLLVDGEPDVDEGEVFYLQAAMEMPESGIEPQVVTEQGLAEADLDAVDLVWLCNVQAPSPALAKRLEEYVAGGGGLAIACGSQVDAARYTELWWRDGKGPLPLPIGEVAGDPDRPERAVLVQKDHPLCGPLGDVFELLTSRVVLVKRWLTILEPAGHTASVVMRIRDGEGPPLLVSRTFGTGGEVALFAVTADAFWSNLPRTDLFVPIANQLHRVACRRRDASNLDLQPDGSYRLQLDPGVHRADVTVRCAAGDGDERTFTAVEPPPEPSTAAPPTTGDEPLARAAQVPLALVVPMHELHQFGKYDVELVRHDGVPEQRAFARNPPPAESRLVAFLDSAFQRLYPQDLQQRVTFVHDGGASATGAGEGELWHVLAAVLLAGLLLESLLAWRFGRR
jgi:hypothetical protein